jgi:putative FmdB family regulatory protein
MPTYDYECRACGKTFEVFHGINEPARKKCPKCGKNRLEKLIGAGVGFLFKGSGFYATDYRSADYKAKAKADTDASSPKASPGASSGPEKSAPSAEKKKPDKT